MTLPGILTLELLLDNVTVRGLDAAAVITIVQSAVPGAFTVAGEQARLLNCAAAARLMTDCLFTPPSVPVTVAFWLLLTAPEVAAKVTVL